MKGYRMKQNLLAIKNYSKIEDKMEYTIIITPQFISVHHESKVAATVAEKKILTLISQVTERDEAIRQLKEERPTTNEVLALSSQVTERDEAIRQLKEELSEVQAVSSQVTERDEEIRLLKEELHKRTKGNV